MKKSTFIKVIKAHQQQEAYIDAVQVIIDVDSPIVEFGWTMFELLLESHFNEEDRDFIYWWLYERVNPHTGEVNEAYDAEGNPIKLDTPEDLWNYLTGFEPECQTCTNS